MWNVECVSFVFYIRVLYIFILLFSNLINRKCRNSMAEKCILRQLNWTALVWFFLFQTQCNKNGHIEYCNLIEAVSVCGQRLTPFEDHSLILYQTWKCCVAEWKWCKQYGTVQHLKYPHCTQPLAPKVNLHASGLWFPWIQRCQVRPLGLLRSCTDMNHAHLFFIVILLVCAGHAHANKRNKCCIYMQTSSS